MSIKDKLLSRKLWLAIIGAGAGIAIALGAQESIVSEVAGALTTLISVVIYIVTEGKVDVAAVNVAQPLLPETTAEQLEEK